MNTAEKKSKARYYITLNNAGPVFGKSLTVYTDEKIYNKAVYNGAGLLGTLWLYPLKDCRVPGNADLTRIERISYKREIKAFIAYCGPLWDCLPDAVKHYAERIIRSKNTP